MNYDWITARIALGSMPESHSDILTLASLGITAIIDVNIQDDAPLFNGTPMEYLFNPTLDDGTPKPTQWFRESIEFAEFQLRFHDDSKLYLHCQAGINRGPSTTYAVIRALYSLLAEDALNLIRIHRPITLMGVRYASDADKALKELGYA